MKCFVRDVSVFRGRFTCWLVFPYPLQPSARCRKLRKKSFYTRKNAHDIIHGKLQAEGGQMSCQDKMAKSLFKVPVYFQSTTRISKMFLIVFVLCSGNMYFLKKIVKWHLMEMYYNFENLGINTILYVGQPARKSAIYPIFLNRGLSMALGKGFCFDTW